MIVGGQTEARAQLSSTIIDYHAPFDQGLRRTREVTPRGRDEIGPPPREEPTTATANASGELLSVPPATRSTAVSKVQPETTPV